MTPVLIIAVFHVMQFTFDVDASTPSDGSSGSAPPQPPTLVVTVVYDSIERGPNSEPSQLVPASSQQQQTLFATPIGSVSIPLHTLSDQRKHSDWYQLTASTAAATAPTKLKARERGQTRSGSVVAGQIRLDLLWLHNLAAFMQPTAK